MAKKKLPVWQEKYGLISTKGPLNAFQWEKEAFVLGATVAEGGLGKYGHLKKLLWYIKPDLEFNPWIERYLSRICDEDYAHKYGTGPDAPIKRVIMSTGCATAGKTFDIGLYAFAFWIADPFNSCVVMTTTTGKMGKKRMWPIITSSFSSHRTALSNWSGYPEHRVHMPNLIDSQMMLQAERGDGKHSISMIAVDEGDTTKALNNIKGQHAPRMLVIIDEMESTPEGIVKACCNLEKATQEFTLIGIGNSSSMIDSHGRMCEPLNGWESIDVDTEEWITNKHPDTGMTGICLHFDGFKSPNVLAGRTLYPYLYTFEDFQKASGREETIETWKQDRGFWAPEGIQTTVMTPQMVNRCKARQVLRFLTWSYPISSLDPAFGGNDCVQLIGKMGDIDATGKTGIQITHRFVIKASATSENEVDRQVALKAIENCKAHGVKPNHFASDTTGTGRSVHSHMYSDWSNLIVKVSFSDSASDISISETDIRPANEVYDRKVTELWFSVAEFVKAEQIGGLYDEAIADFCARRFIHEKHKFVLETKKDFKKRSNNRSPDDGDAVAIMIELARRLGANPGLRMKSGDSNKTWLALAQENVYTDAIATGPDANWRENEQLFAPL